MDTLITRAEAACLADHATFLGLLKEIHASESLLSTSQRWRMRYMDAWEAQFEGKYPEAEKTLHDIIEHAGDPVLAARATGMLLSNYSITRRYQDAFALANRAAAGLPLLHDVKARYSLLSNLSQTLNFADHPELAVQYARMITEVPPGETHCRPQALEMAALYSTKTLRSDSPGLLHAIDACSGPADTVLHNMVQLIRSTLLFEEQQPTRSLALLDQIAPSIEATGYFAARISLGAVRAQCQEALHNDGEARRQALAVVAMFDAGAMDRFLRDAYEVLYHVEKRAGHADAALKYYQLFEAQDRAYLDDEAARTLAYEAVQQRLLLQGLQADKLGRQKATLELEQALANNAVESSRLYMALLGVILLSVVAWLLRVRRSQKRYRHLSYHDGLTGIFNHQHFMERASAVVDALERQKLPASVLLLDLDHFKRLNDTFGHAVGDAVLQRAVAAIQVELRTEDVFGRLGGEEFGVLLPGCLPEQALLIAHRVRAAVDATPLAMDGQLVRYSASVGMASTLASGHRLERLLADADVALYRAKRAGRNRVMA
ncbi:GGDEF domain-containing protein [Bacillus sp. NP157]|nr:GGDEF domain-containing protein [Bacillus sp. NP157]